VASAPKTVTVTNTGVGPLLVSGLTSTNPAEFSIAPSSNCLGSPILAGATCTVSVTFTPAALGARSGSLLIADNAAGSPQSIPLTGTGAPVPAPVVSTTPTVAAGLAFGNIVTSQPSAALPVTVTNTGTGPLTVSGVTVGGANPTEFVVSGNTCLAG